MILQFSYTLRLKIVFSRGISDTDLARKVSHIQG
jgi:hypothetical protein